VLLGVVIAEHFLTFAEAPTVQRLVNRTGALTVTEPAEAEFLHVGRISGHPESKPRPWNLRLSRGLPDGGCVTTHVPFLPRRSMPDHLPLAELIVSATANART
jgi:hypothetical protein